jgi:hypothetical protein
MTAFEIYAAWGDLSLYTNAESCPMRASAVRRAGFKQYVYGTTIEHNYNAGSGRADLVVLRCLTPESGAAGRANGHAGPDLDQQGGPAVQLAI